MTSNVELFNHAQFGRLRVCELEGDSAFVASDACRGLDIKNTADALKRLDEDEKGIVSIYTPGGDQAVWCVTFPGLLSLILGSRKPEAKEYKRWVTHEVLPAIHKHGGYMVARAEETPEQTIARALIMAKASLERKEQQIAIMAPKAVFADQVLDSEGTYTITEAARLLKQVDKDMCQKRLFALLRADELIEKGSNKATAKAVERGYLYNYIPKPYEDPMTGEKKLRQPYARVRAKGLRWMNERYCNARQLETIEVA